MNSGGRRAEGPREEHSASLATEVPLLGSNPLTEIVLTKKKHTRGLLSPTVEPRGGSVRRETEPRGGGEKGDARARGKAVKGVYKRPR